MTLETLCKFLAGNREAILSIARSRRALGVGLLFVLAAGLAREYDGEDLLHEPWHLLIPLLASIGSSLILYLLVRCVAWTRGAGTPGLVEGYLTFLTLYWLTAPLALLYGIPVERMLSAANAVAANLWLLGIVATWRVLLITRVISVLYSTSFAAAFFPVMLFADSLLLVVLYLTPLPLLMIMGGVRLSDADSTLLGTSLVAGFLGYVTWLVWLIGTLAVRAFGSPWRYQELSAEMAGSVTRPVWLAAIGACMIWLLFLPFTQSEQRLRRKVERALLAEQFPVALELMTAHEQHDFPPHWDPPPWQTRARPRPKMIDLQEATSDMQLKPWVRSLWDAKFADFLRAETWHSLSELPNAEIDRRLNLIERIADGSLVSEADVQGSLEEMLKRDDLSDETRARIAALLGRPSAPLPAQTQSPDVAERPLEAVDMTTGQQP